jgi:rhodanese-related sulfurtransferase
MPVKTVNPSTLQQWLNKGEAVVVDVREPAEYAASNIAGSTLLPLANVSKSALPQTAGKKLVVHCQSGKRSASACARLLSEDPMMEIYELEGGIAAWHHIGQQTHGSGKAFLPLDRQVQLTIGLSVLTTSLLAYFVSPSFALVAAFFGAGLTFAGLSGYCGLAMLMAKMPWNQGSTEKPTCCASPHS